MVSHDPFDIGSEKLRSLDTGLIAGDDVNCDEAEMIGPQIQQSLDNLSKNNATAKRSLKAVTLASLKPSVKINDEKIVVDPLVLFSRLIILMHRYGDISCFFDYELSHVPTSLFDGFPMGKSNKLSLAKGLDKLLAKSNEEVIEVPQEAEDDIDEDDIDSVDEFDDITDISNSATASVTTRYVIDGDYFLRRDVWAKNITFR